MIEASPSLARVSVVPAHSVFVPIRTISASNSREHYMARARRVKGERTTTVLLMRGMAAAEMVNRHQLLSRFPVIRLTRVAGPRGRTLDDDNLRGCLKACRDGVADWLGVNDNDYRVSWYYAQRKGFHWGVEVEVCAC